MPTFLPCSGTHSVQAQFVNIVSLATMDTLSYITVIADKKRRIFATFPPGHKPSSMSGEIFDSKGAAILRLEDWACT